MGDKFIELLKNKNGVKIVFFELLIAFLILAGGLVGQVHADIPAIERSALIAFYNSTGGDNWINNTGWKIGDEFAAPGTECTSPWYGVVCRGGHVVKLNLEHNQLSGNIPTELGDLTNLQYLGLYGNQLTGSIPSELSNLTNLQFLFLYTNQLTDNIPAELGSLSNLWELILHDNQLSGNIPAELGNLANLILLRQAPKVRQLKTLKV